MEAAIHKLPTDDAAADLFAQMEMRPKQPHQVMKVSHVHQSTNRSMCVTTTPTKLAIDNVWEAAALQFVARVDPIDLLLLVLRPPRFGSLHT